MKKLFFVFCCSLCFLNAKSQTHLFGEYSAQKVTTSTPDNKNDRYKWLLEKERYYMFFPQTADGLANLHDKIQLILVGSNLEIDEPNIKDNVIPKQFEELNDLNQISDLINKGIIRMQHRWNLNGKQLGMTVSDNFYIIFVRNID